MYIYVEKAQAAAAAPAAAVTPAGAGRHESEHVVVICGNVVCICMSGKSTVRALQ